MNSSRSTASGKHALARVRGARGVARSRQSRAGARRSLSSLSAPQVQRGPCGGHDSSGEEWTVLEAVGTGVASGQLSGQTQPRLRTHHVLRDKHVEIQAVLADRGQGGRPGPWLPAAGPADTDGVTARRINRGAVPVSLPAQRHWPEPLPARSAASRWHGEPRSTAWHQAQRPPPPHGPHRNKATLALMFGWVYLPEHTAHLSTPSPTHHSCPRHHPATGLPLMD